MEHIVDTFANGIKNLIKNPVLFVPVTLLSILIFVITVPITLFIADLITSGIALNLLTIISVSSVFFILTLLLVAFFSAGLIGMIKEAVEKGKTRVSDFFSYGGKYTVRMFLSVVLLFILNGLALIFWIPLYNTYIKSGLTLTSIFYSFYDFFLSGNIEPFMEIISIFAVSMVIGLLLTFVYSLILTVLFYFVSYAIVIDGLPVIAAFKKSLSLLKQYPGKVIIFIIIVNGLVMAILQISEFFVMFFIFNVFLLLLGGFLYLLFALFINTAALVWTARFYMAITEKELYVEEKLADSY
jgi:hypothetical protein